MFAPDINETITKFTDAFNRNDLDAAMSFFSENAVYEPGDGRVHRGKKEIRAALEPQFHASYGTMRFDDRDRILDEANGKAAFRWICRHDLANARPGGLWMGLRNLLVGWTIGRRFGWQGVDVFHFDSEGKIKGKFTYGWFGSRPLIQAALG